MAHAYFFRLAAFICFVEMLILTLLLHENFTFLGLFGNVSFPRMPLAAMSHVVVLSSL